MIYFGSSLQFSHELGIFKNYGCTKHSKLLEVKERDHLWRLSLSLHALRQDHWSNQVYNKINRPLYVIPYRCNTCMCHSFSIMRCKDGIPIVKSTTLMLSRTYDALSGQPLLLQLVPAIGLVAFSVWGLEPLLRYSRNFFKHNDNNWKKSRTQYVFTSYLQPLLLWTGVILICRAMDPVILSSEASNAVKQRLLNFIRSLSTVLAFAYCLSRLIQEMQKFTMDTNECNDSQNVGFHFAGKAMYTTVWVAAVSLFMELLGFSTQKWLTAGGFGTVLLTLAGREIFTNFLSSIMIHATRPFVLDEWIQTKIEGYEVSGTVERVGWWSPTIIRGDDREAVHIPNHKFTVNVVRNLSQKTHWRVKTHLALSHLDANKISTIVADMRKVLGKNPQVEQQRLHRRVFLEYIDSENQAFMILISCFVKTSHFEEFLCVKEAILLDLLRVISHHRARLATPIRTVQKIYSNEDLENIPFAETIVTPASTPFDRPLYLIETTSRINNDDKTKARPEPHASYLKNSTTSDQRTADPTFEGSNSQDTQEQKATDSVESSSVSDGTVQSDLEDQVQKIKSSSTPFSSPKSLIGLDFNDSTCIATSLESNSEQDEGAKIHMKNESAKTATPPPVTRSSLEDNMVLGVALDGSKRTLAIEEGIDTSSTVEVKELTGHRNVTGSSAVPGGVCPGDQQKLT